MNAQAMHNHLLRVLRKMKYYDEFPGTRTGAIPDVSFCLQAIVKAWVKHVKSVEKFYSD